MTLEEKIMTILYPIIDGEWSGGNIVCLHIVKEALRRGHRVIINSPTQAEFTEFVRKLGVSVYHVDTRRSYHFGATIQLAQIIRKERVNLVHTHGPLASTILGAIAGRLSKVPTIIHAHAQWVLSAHPVIKAYQLVIYRLVARYCADKIIAVAESVQKDIICQGTPQDKTVVIYNGVETSRTRGDFTERRVRLYFGIPDNYKVVGEVARLAPEKGQLTLLKAAKLVIEKYPQVTFVIVGKEQRPSEHYRDKLECMLDDLNIRQNVVLTGFYPRDIMDLMNLFDLFVLPCEGVEGLPVSILEALSAGKPVVTTPVAGNTEAVIDGETGFIVPPKDPQQLAKAILYLLQNSDKAQKMGQKGLELIRTRFSLKQMLEKTFRIYEEVLNSRKVWPEESVP